MSKESTEFTLPSSPADRRKIKDAIYEITAAMREMKDKRSYINDTKKDLKEKFGLPPKIAGKMAKTVFDQSFQDVLAESETFEVVYGNLFETNNTATDSSDE